MKDFEYIPKPRNRIWRASKILAVTWCVIVFVFSGSIAPEGFMIIFTQTIPMLRMLFGPAALILVFGFLFKT